MIKQDCGYIKHGNMKHNLIEKSGLILYSHLSPLEENVLSLVIIVELDILVWDAHLESNMCAMFDDVPNEDLGDWDGLPGEHGLVDDAASLHQHGVALDCVAAVSGEQHVVTRHQLRGGQLNLWNGFIKCL